MQRFTLSLLLLIFAGVMVWGVETYYTSQFPGANDFYQRWYGARAYWVQGRNPYSPEVAREVELTLYGAPASTDPKLDQYPGDFLYPFPMAILIAPLTVLPYEWASAIWMVLTAAGAATAFVLCADLFNWRPKPLLMIVGVIWAVLFYPTMRGVFLGQPGTLAVCLQIATIWALAKQRDQHDIAAGVFLALSTFKPQLGLLLIPFLGLWGLRFARWRFLISLGVAGGLLYGLSFLFVPSWLNDWLRQITLYTGYTQIGSPIWVITSVYLPFLGPTVETILNAILLLVTLGAWGMLLWRRDNSLFVWTAALTMTVTHMILVRTATPHFVIYLIVIVFSFRELHRYGTVWLLATMAVLLVGLWWLFLATVVGRFESPALYVPLPVLSLFLLLLTRHRWIFSTPKKGQ